MEQKFIPELNKEVSIEEESSMTSLSFGDKRWIVEKLRAGTDKTWTESDVAKLREILQIPDIHSVDIETLPHSELGGLHLTLNQNNTVEIRDLLQKVLGENWEKTKDRILSAYSFLIVDNLVIPHSTFQNTYVYKSHSGYEQKLHREMVAGNILAFYHPSIDTSRFQRSRTSNTLFSDAKLFADKLVHYLQQWVEATAVADVPEGLLELYKAVQVYVGQEASTYGPHRRGEQPLTIKEVIEDIDSRRNQEMTDYINSFSHRYTPEYAYAHKWKETQLIVLNDELLVHGKGGIPDKLRYDYYDQPIITLFSDDIKRLMEE